MLRKAKNTKILFLAIHLVEINKDILNNKCILLDCDTFYNIDILEIYRFQKDNAIFCFIDNQDKPIYSYIKLHIALLIEILQLQFLAHKQSWTQDH